MNRNFIIIIISVIVISSCAQFGTPQGGPPDKEPPIIVKQLSEPNFQTQFNKSSFDLVFNEWITLSNPSKEVVTSPPTDYPLQLTGRGKTVKVRFNEKEQLKENATYQINFGDAVRDFTEGNIYKNLVFVFSTGDVIDSLSVNGTVYDALTLEPREDIIVSLYDDLSDSCIVKNKPFYFTKTDKSGRYKLSNIRNDSFQLFALKDENVNYYYDLGSEEVAYFDSLVILKDSSAINLDLYLFNEDDPSRLVESVQDRKGLIKIYFNPKPEDYKLLKLPSDTCYSHLEYKGDSLLLWHDAIKTDDTFFVLEHDAQTDTIPNKKARKSMSELQLTLDRSVKNTINTFADDTIKVSFNKPLDSINIDRFVLEDSLKSYKINAVMATGRQAAFLVDSLINKATYSLSILPKGIKDIYGNYNMDTISLQLKTNDPEQYGNISLNCVLKDSVPYLFTLSLGNSIIHEDVIDSTRILSFTRLAKGKYNVQLIEDRNNDGKWTSGILLEKKPPERIKEITLEELKPGWDLELDILVKEIFDGTTLE